jgi:hypothetical protein
MLTALANWLFGCSHRRTGFPMTRRIDRGPGRYNSRKTETYVVCLDCGARMTYDWKRMRRARQPVSNDRSTRARPDDCTHRLAAPAVNRWFARLVHHA